MTQISSTRLKTKFNIEKKMVKHIDYIDIKLYQNSKKQLTEILMQVEVD